MSDHDIPIKNKPLQTTYPHEKEWHWRVRHLPLRTTRITHYNTCHAFMISPQRRKGKHMANRKFPRKQAPRNSHRPTPDDAVHRPDGTPNMTSPYRTLKKEKNLDKCSCQMSVYFKPLHKHYEY